MKLLCSSISIGDRVIGEGSPSYIIAEAGSNHNQNYDMAKKLIDAAVSAQADAVKFQTFTADTIAAKLDNPLTKIDIAGIKTLYELYKGLELPRHWQKDLFDYSKERGITFLSTPFDEKAVDELYEIGVKAFKIASFEIGHFPLLRHVAKTGRPVILSTGMAILGEIEEALDVLIGAGCKHIALLHCGISYPMNPDEVNLRAMETMARAFGCPVGYSDHTLGIAVPVAAVTLGARVIEKHFTLSRDLPGPDHGFALEPDELTQMVESIRVVERALGSPIKGPTESELIHKKRGCRSLYAARPIKKGTILTEDMISILRPAAGLHPRFIAVVVGKKAIRDIDDNEPITWDSLMD